MEEPLTERQIRVHLPNKKAFCVIPISEPQQ
jgi:hypothetical protein